MSDPLSNNNQPVTFNEGQGKKDQIVMTGPLSEVLSRGLNIFLEKKELTAEPQAPEVDAVPAPAKESYSQDHYMETMLANMETTPGLNLVLDNFDISDVKDHVAKIKDGDIEAQLNEPAPTSIFVTDPNDIVQSRTAEELINQAQDTDLIVVTIQDTTSMGQPTGPELTTVEHLKELEGAAERIYEGTRVKICWGLEAMCNHLVKKLNKAE